MREIYKNAPLIEAVFEIRFLAEISVKFNTGSFYNQMKENFPIFVEHLPEPMFIYFSRKNRYREIKNFTTD